MLLPQQPPSLPLTPELTRRLAEANLANTQYQRLGHEQNAQRLRQKIADAKITLNEAQRPHAESLTIDTLKRQLQKLMHELCDEKICLAACRKALIQAHETYERATAFSPVQTRVNEAVPTETPTNNNQAPIANGSTYHYYSFPAAPTLENRYGPTPPTSSTTQSMTALQASPIAQQQSGILAEAIRRSDSVNSEQGNPH